MQAALATGQRLFHARGYEAVGLAALTKTLGIKPPSFYAAFGSKAGFFEQVLQRYAASVLALEDVLRPGRPPVEALADLIESAARTYAADDSAMLARQVAQGRRDQIRAFVAATHPEVADAVVDYVVSTMSGLSGQRARRDGGGPAWRCCAHLLYTNEAMVENIALYTRMGYVETSRREEGGLRRVCMRTCL